MDDDFSCSFCFVGAFCCCFLLLVFLLLVTPHKFGAVGFAPFLWGAGDG